MKKILLLLALAAVLIAACNQTAAITNKLISQNNLPAQLFSINTGKDTLITTANGALINIPRGALSGALGNVTLEIKEAYTIEQMLLAGLTTQSTNGPLSSGGMINISPAAGESFTISKAIAVSIPTPSLNKNMQLYKAEVKENGQINWAKPANLPHNLQLDRLDEGSILFAANCASCHHIGTDGRGPNLAHVVKRTPDRSVLYRYTRDNQLAMTHTEEPYYRCLYNRWNKSAMTLFPALTDSMLNKLYGYIENESEIRNLPVPKDDIRPCIDSCMTYWGLKYRLEEQKEKLTAEKIKMIIENVVPPAPSADTIGLPLKVSPAHNRSLYYQFTIDAFGWYNIDVLLNDANAVQSSLMVRLTGSYHININLYLAIPAAKVLEPGGLLEGQENTYGFYKTDGTIPLPQNATAYILAVGEYDDKIVFAKKTFTTAPSLSFDMSPAIVSKEVFNASIKNLDLGNIQFTAHDTQNADTLRKLVRELKDVEKLKPRNCDCHCIGWERFPVSDTSAVK